jgi:hypothetical protein
VYAEEQETKTLRITKKWKIYNTSILQRKYRCTSAQDGRKKIRMICDVLSEDDTFKMSDTHKVSAFACFSVKVRLLTECFKEGQIDIAVQLGCKY